MIPKIWEDLIIFTITNQSKRRCPEEPMRTQGKNKQSSLRARRLKSPNCSWFWFATDLVLVCNWLVWKLVLVFWTNHTHIVRQSKTKVIHDYIWHFDENCLITLQLISLSHLISSMKDKLWYDKGKLITFSV